MDNKESRLQRYSRKDYTQQVVFPVEIVGRDGVVRRYSFQSSVRLYQRRIASAPGRYTDPELVRAEVSHCRQRIRQLRQSYYRRYGFSDLAVSAEDTGEFAGEVSAFLRRCFGDLQLQLVALERMDDPESSPQTWYLSHPESGVPYLLSLFRFQHYGSCPAREAFFENLRVLRSSQGPDVEALVAFHHSGDCGLVLSCPGAHADAPLGEFEDCEPQEPENPSWDEGLRAIAHADLEQALEHLEQAQLLSPYSRRIAVACATIAEQVGAHSEAETAARIGLGALPQDTTLRYLLALSLFKQGRLAASLEQLQGLRGSARLPQIWLLAGLLELRGGRMRRGDRLLAKAQHAARLSDLVPAIRGLRLRAGGLAGALLMAWLGGLLAVLSLLLGGPAALPVVGLGLVVFGVAASATLLFGLARRLSLRRLIRLRLPPAEAIGARGPESELRES